MSTQIIVISDSIKNEEGVFANAIPFENVEFKFCDYQCLANANIEIGESFNRAIIVLDSNSLDDIGKVFHTVKNNSKNLSLKIIMVSDSSDPMFILDAYSLGIGSYVFKSEFYTKISNIFIALMNEKLFVLPSVFALLMSYYDARKNKSIQDFENLNSSLSEKEKACVSLLLKGSSYKEMAFELKLTVDGVNKRVSKIYAKLGISNRNDLYSLFYPIERFKTTEMN